MMPWLIKKRATYYTKVRLIKYIQQESGDKDEYEENKNKRGSSRILGEPMFMFIINRKQFI